MKNINIIFNIIFKIIKKIMRFFVISFLILLVLFVLLFIFYFSYWVYIDQCYDLGGIWNKELNTCDGTPTYDEWYKRWKGYGLDDHIEMAKKAWEFLLK